jgi:hypothetical protein
MFVGLPDDSTRLEIIRALSRVRKIDACLLNKAFRIR